MIIDYQSHGDRNFVRDDKLLNMKYIDKNGEEWSINKGDWVGSHKKESNKPTNYVYLVVVITIVALILLGIR